MNLPTIHDVLDLFAAIGGPDWVSDMQLGGIAAVLFIVTVMVLALVARYVERR